MRFTTRYSAAFTLIELLVVVSIIALLIAVLLPVLSSARAASRSAICMSNQRQIATACTGYGVDADGNFAASSTNDEGRITPYPFYTSGEPDDPTILGGKPVSGEYLPASAVYGCPSNPLYDYSLARPNDGSYGFGRSNTAYAMVTSAAIYNFIDVVYGPGSDPSAGDFRPSMSIARLDQVLEPSRTIWTIDVASLRNWGGGDPGPGRMIARFSPTSVGGFQEAAHLLHTNRANTSFFDGHVETLDAPGLNATATGVTHMYDVDYQLLTY